MFHTSKAAGLIRRVKRPEQGGAGKPRGNKTCPVPPRPQWSFSSFGGAGARGQAGGHTQRRRTKCSPKKSDLPRKHVKYLTVSIFQTDAVALSRKHLDRQTFLLCGCVSLSGIRLSHLDQLVVVQLDHHYETHAQHLQALGCTPLTRKKNVA